MGCSRWRSRFSFRLLCAVLSALLVGLPLAPRHAYAAVETSDAGAGDGFAFAEKASSANTPLVGAAKANAIAWRDAPVGASGEFVYSLPIDTTPGRLGMSPHVALDHSSSRRTQSSPVGVGWSLEMPTIRRSTLYKSPAVKKLADETLTDDKRFVYDESRAIFESPAGVLVPLDAGAGPGPWGLVRGLLYVSERESSPVYYEFQSEAQSGIKGGLWLEYDPSGVTRYYGGESVSRRRAQVTTELGTFAWLLLYEQDVHGNDIEYLYHNIEDQDRSTLTSAQREPVLKQINWGGNRTLGLSSLFTLTTQLGVQAGDHSLTHGNLLLSSRVDFITITGPEGLYWRYVLAYESGPMTGRQRLLSVTRQAPRAAGGAAVEVTNRWNFGYSDKSATIVWNSKGEPLPESVYAEGYQATGGISMPSPGEAADEALNPSSSRSGTKFVDLDGDGRTDAIYHLAGIELPAAHIRANRSFLAPWAVEDPQPIGTNRVLGGPWSYISELADLDADNDLDAVRFDFALVSPEEALEGMGGPAFCNVVNQRCCADVSIECTGGLPAMECFDGGRCVDLVEPEDAIIWPIEKFDAMAQAALRGYATGQAWSPTDFGQWAHDNALGLLPGAGVDPGGTGGFGKWSTSDLVSPLAARSTPEGMCSLGMAACRGVEVFDTNTECVDTTAQCTLPLDQIHPICAAVCTELARQKRGGPRPFAVHDPNAPFYGKTYRALVYENIHGTAVFDATAKPVTFAKWPFAAAQRSSVLGKPRDPNSNNVDPFPYDLRTLSDFLAPLADVNGDGRADVVLLKAVETPLEEACIGDKYKFFPRAYLRQGDSFPLDEDSESHAAFSRSLRSILRDDREEFCGMFNTANVGQVECNAEQPLFPVDENFNSFLMDVNSDGLADLIVAKRPTTSADVTTCVDGHDVFLNRGYRFDFVDTNKRAMVADGWSSSADVHAAHPFARLRNYQPHARDCTTGTAPEDVATCSKSYESITSGPIPGLPMRAFSQVDLNADGRTDAALLSYDQATHQRTSDVYLNTGRGFTLARNIIDWPRIDYGSLFTLNKLPMLADFVTSVESARDLPPLVREAAATSDVGRFADVDGDGLTDLVTPGHCKVVGIGQVSLFPGDDLIKTDLLKGFMWRICKRGAWYRNRSNSPSTDPNDPKDRGRLPDLLTSVKSNSGSWLAIDYVAATSTAASSLIKSDEKPAGLMVVQRVQRGDSVAEGSAPTPTETITFRYDQYTRDTKSREAMGFERVQATFDNGAGLSLITTRTFDVRPYVSGLPVPHPLRGKLVKEELWSSGAGGNPYRRDTSEKRYYWDVANVDSGACGRARVRPRTQVTRECSAVGTDDHCVMSASWTGAFDDDGFAAETLTGEIDPGKVFTWEQFGADHGFAPPFTGRVERTASRFVRPTGVWRRGVVEHQAVSEMRFDANAPSSRLPLPGPDLLVVDRTFYNNGDTETETHVGVTPAACTTSTGESADSTVSYTYRDSGLLDTVSQTSGGAARTVTYEPDSYELYPAKQTARFDRYVSGAKQTLGGVLIAQGQFDYRHGQATQITDANGKTFTSTYDSLGRALTRSGPSGELLEELSYQDDVASGRRWSHRKLYQSAGKWSEQRAYLDGADRVLAAVSWSSDTAIVRDAFNFYDGFGALVRTVLPERVTTSDFETLAASAVGDAGTDRVLDAFGRVWLETLPDLRERRWDYQPGWVRETSPRLTSTDQYSDWAGRVVQVQKLDIDGAVSGSWIYQRDALGRIERMDDGDSSARWLEWDGGGRLYRATLSHPANVANPDRFAWCYAGDGHVLSATTPAGREVTFVRDGLGRSVQEWHRGGDAGRGAGAGRAELARSYQYDDAAHASLARLWRVEDEAGVRELSYDGYGRPDVVKLQPAAWVGDAPAGKTYAVDFDYNPQGTLGRFAVTARASSSATSGTSLGGADYARDGRGRVTSVTRIGSSSEFVGGITYDEHDRMRAATIGGSVAASWAFDPLSQWLDGIGYGTTSGELTALHYGHDPNGNLTNEWRTDLRHRADVSGVEMAGAPIPAGLLSSKQHTYDAQDRLHSSAWQVSDVGVDRSEQYEYSPGGSIQWVDTEGTGRTTYIYGSPATSQAVTSLEASGLSRELDYDSDGFAVTDRSWWGTNDESRRSLAFDAQGCLRHVEQSGSHVEHVSTEQACDEGGQRLMRRTQFSDGRLARVIDLFGVGELRLDEGPSGGGGLWLLRLPVNGTTVVEDAHRLSDGVVVVDASRVVLNDVRGSVVGEAPLVGGGGSTIQLVRGAEYGAWGERSAVAQGLALTRHGFVGVEPDPGTEFYYFGKRVYDPALRRFLSADGFVLASPGTCLAATGNCDLFSYSGNNPVRFTDPSGMAPRDALVDQTQPDPAAHAQKEAAANLGAVASVAEGSATFVNAIVNQANSVDISGGNAPPSISAPAGIDPASFAAGKTVGTVGMATVGVVALLKGIWGSSKAAGGIVENGTRGRASEGRVLADMGLEKNTATVSTAEGSSIPDALTDSLSVEIKDAARVSATRQIRIQTEAAAASGRESILVTGTKTKVSRQTADSFDQVVRRSDLGPQR